MRVAGAVTIFRIRFVRAVSFTPDPERDESAR